MASRTITVTSVRRVNGRAYIRLSNGAEREYSSLVEAREFAHDPDALTEMAFRLILARYLRVDPNGNNPSLIEGHSITLTDENNSMAVVT